LFTVTNTNDGPVAAAGDLPGSLRQAIFDANALAGADTIDFDASFNVAQTITLSAGSLVITEDLTITGKGQNLLTISGNDATNVFFGDFSTLAVVGNLKVTDLTVTKGKLTGTTSVGAGFGVTQGNLVLTNVTISACTGQSSGAGIFVDDGPLQIGGSLVCTNCILTGNSVTTPGIANTAFYGVAVAVAGTAATGGPTATFTNCQITNNTGNSTATNSDLFGAIGLATGGKVTLTDCIVSGNTNDGQGGMMQFQTNDIDIVRTTFDNNKTTSGAGGGFRINVDAGNTVNIIDSTFSNNSTANSGGALVASSGAGTVNVVNSTFSGNFATGNGGVLRTFGAITSVWNFVNSTFTTNSTNGLGSGISESTAAGSDAKINIESSIVAQNSGGTTGDIAGTINLVSFSIIGAKDGSTITTTASSLVGTKASPIDAKLGPLGLFGGTTRVHLPQTGSPAINAGSNTLGLTNDQRGGGFPRAFGGGVDIGAVEANNPSPFVSGVSAPNITVAGGSTAQFTITFADNNGIDVATLSAAGAVTVSGGAFGAPVNAVFKSVDVNTNGTPRTATYEFTAPGGTFDVTDNATYNINIVAGKIFDIDAPTPLSVPAGQVGTVKVAIPQTFVVNATNDESVDSDGKTSLREAIIAANKATGADSVTFDPTVFSSPQTIFLDTATDRIDVTDSVTIQGPAQKVTVDGGATLGIFNFNGTGVITVVVNDLTLANGNELSTAFGRGGGAAYVADESVTFNNVRFENNKSAVSGGAVHSNGASVLTFNNAFMTGNQAQGGFGGGAIGLTGTGTLNVNGSTLTGNSTAGGPGGAIYALVNSTINIDKSTVSGNAAALSAGGGVYFFNTGTLNVTNSTISGNTADLSGGGVYMFAPTGLLISNSTISGNTATNDGGGVYVANLAVAATIRNSTIALNTANGTVIGGGGIALKAVAVGGSLTLSSTIVAKNVNGISPDVNADVAVNIGGNNNFIGDKTGSVATFTGVGNLTGDPLLDPSGLKSNGGPTETIALQAGSPAINTGNNAAGLATDQRGLQRVAGGTADIGAYEFGATLAAPPTVTSVKVNGVGTQRSMVTSLVVTFSEAVSFPSGINAAFALNRIAPQPTGGPSTAAPLGLVNTSAVQAGNTVTITFLAGGAVPIDLAGSLIDGNYQLTIDASKVTGAGGNLDGDGNGTGGDNFQTPATGASRVFRMFGDNDGDGDVDSIDFGQFRAAFGGANATFDHDGDGDVDSVDFGQFRSRFGSAV